MPKDWRNKNDYDYMDDHTNELWAWEFLRRNPEYRKDWISTLAGCKYNHTAEKISFTQLIDSSIAPESLPFDGAQSKWGLYIDDILNPDNDKPSFPYPYPLFYTYGYYYGKDSMDSLPILKDREVFAHFDLAQPILQQLDHFKKLLEEDQKYELVYSDLIISEVKNKKIYWKDYIRILDAFETNAKRQDIAAVIFPHVTNIHPSYHGSRRVRDSFNAAKEYRDGKYRNILKEQAQLKRR